MALPPQKMTEQEKADLQVWLRWGRIGTGRSYQEEVQRAYRIEAERALNAEKGDDNG